MKIKIIEEISNPRLVKKIKFTLTGKETRGLIKALGTSNYSAYYSFFCSALRDALESK